MRIGFLHTVPALAPRFDADLAQAVPGATAVHAIDAELLATAIRSGVDEAIEAAVAAHIEHRAVDGADAVLVTCSSIGEAVEKAAASASVPVVRVDIAMADEAVRAAEADVIVLAQASMAPAAERSTVPVLTSPASALAAVLEAAR